MRIHKEFDLLRIGKDGSMERTMFEDNVKRLVFLIYDDTDVCNDAFSNYNNEELEEFIINLFNQIRKDKSYGDFSNRFFQGHCKDATEILNLYYKLIN